MADPVADPFAQARLEHPGCKLGLLHDPDGTGYDFILAIPPSSPWYELLPETQESTIDRKAKAGAAGSLLPPLGNSLQTAPADAYDEHRVKRQ